HTRRVRVWGGPGVARCVGSAWGRVGASTGVPSAACGADLLVLAAARKLGLGRRIALPYRRDWFVADSVLDRPGRWKALYEAVCDEARATRNLVTLRGPRGTEEAFRAANERIAEETVRLAAGERRPGPPPPPPPLGAVGG